MDLLGTPDRPVIAGFSIGGTSPLNPPGLCEINLSTAAAAADLAPFGVIQGVTASLMPCLIGEGTEPHLFELFNEGADAGNRVRRRDHVCDAGLRPEIRRQRRGAVHAGPAERSEPREGGLLWSRVRAAGQPDLHDGSDTGVRDGAEPGNRPDRRAVRSAGEPGRMRILPQRDDDHLPGLPVRYGRADTATRQDRINGSDVGVRHERRRHRRCDDRLRVGDASKQEPGQSDVQPAGGVPGHGLPDGVLRRGGNDDGDDDVHGRRQQRVRAVHANGGLPDQSWRESAGGLLRDAE